jgi:hypothetical protein
MKRDNPRGLLRDAPFAFSFRYQLLLITSIDVIKPSFPAFAMDPGSTDDGLRNSLNHCQVIVVRSAGSAQPWLAQVVA